MSNTTQSGDTAMNTISENPTLFDLYVRYCQVANRADGTKAGLRAAIRLFDLFLGRESRVSDFDDLTLVAYREWLSDPERLRQVNQEKKGRPLSPKTARSYGSSLSALWRFAAYLRVSEGPPKRIAWDPDKAGLMRGRAISQAELDDPPPGTLWQAFRAYGELRLLVMSQETLRKHVLGIRWFDRFLGRHATFADLTDETVLKFASWLDEPREDGRPRAERTTDSLIERLLAFWVFCANAAYVDRLPTVKRKNRWEANIEARRADAEAAADSFRAS